MFELLVFSGALAELTWPAILSKRHIFRYYSNGKLNLGFMYLFFSVVSLLHLLIREVTVCREVFADFDPIMVAKFNEKKITSPGSTASSLLSELKLRAIIENAAPNVQGRSPVLPLHKPLNGKMHIIDITKGQLIFMQYNRHY